MFSKSFAAPAIFAAAALVAMPSEAAVSLPAAPVAPVAAVSHYGPYIGIGSGWGWGGGYRGRHHRRGSSAGDILTGVVILGTIAAVANAANKNRERRSYPDRYPENRRWDDRGDYRRDGPQGLEGAADLCLREIERDARVREVTRVERSAGGWRVTGEMADGSGFTCSIGADGRVEQIDVGGRAQALGEDRQYDDERYRSARAEVDAQTGVRGDTGGAQASYPGGPLPGEGAEDDTPQS